MEEKKKKKDSIPLANLSTLEKSVHNTQKRLWWKGQQHPPPPPPRLQKLGGTKQDNAAAPVSGKKKKKMQQNAQVTSHQCRQQRQWQTQ